MAAGRTETQIIDEVDGTIGIYGNGTKFISIDGDAKAMRQVDPTAAGGYSTGAGGAVTQVTSAATAVTLNKPCGVITTVALTTAAGAEEAFVVNNSLVAATDVIALSTTYAGAGKPFLSVTNVGAGVFTINITNVDAAALNALMVINFAVIKVVNA